MAPKRMFVLAVAVALIAAACGGDDEDTSQHAGHSQTQDIGQVGDPDDATMTVEVSATDPYEFDPDSVEVPEGTTVTFVVTNVGGTEHEFVLGTEASHDSGEHDHASGQAVDVEPGETKELTWTFTTAGEVIYACHIAGHYDQGMFGTITVS